jgi:hypothetical protein
VPDPSRGETVTVGETFAVTETNFVSETITVGQTERNAAPVTERRSKS